MSIAGNGATVTGLFCASVDNFMLGHAVGDLRHRQASLSGLRDRVRK